MIILVLNCGSSSVKYRLFNMADETILAGGIVEKIGEDQAILTHQWNDDTLRENTRVEDHVQAIEWIRDLLLDSKHGGVEKSNEIAAVGHRVVHGGEHFFHAAKITADCERAIEEVSTLAPLHNFSNLLGIRAAQECFAEATHVAVFDTAFHQTMPETAFLYPIPYRLYKQDHIRKYGFHGTSHRFVSQRAAELLGKKTDAFTGITCHLGNGCSLAAIRNGQSVDTSMGLTPLEGVAMGTRSGDIDPAIINHLAIQKGLSIEEIDHLLNRESGLLGISEISNDVRDIQKAAQTGNSQARQALEVFAYRVRKYIGSYLAVLAPLDAIVFTGGIGENAHEIRQNVLEDLESLGILISESRNRDCKGREAEISEENSPIKLWVIPTNEELLIARDSRDLLLSESAVQD